MADVKKYLYRLSRFQDTKQSYKTRFPKSVNVETASEANKKLWDILQAGVSHYGETNKQWNSSLKIALKIAADGGYSATPCAETVSQYLRDAYKAAGLPAFDGDPLVTTLNKLLAEQGWIAWDPTVYVPPAGSVGMNTVGISPSHTYMIGSLAPEGMKNARNGEIIFDNSTTIGKDLSTPKVSDNNLLNMYDTGAFWTPAGIVPLKRSGVVIEPTPVPESEFPELKEGSEGDAVIRLQKFLNANGFGVLSGTGFFGASTKKAVIAFQKAVGRPTLDGIVGKYTWENIKNYKAPVVTPSNKDLNALLLAKAKSYVGVKEDGYNKGKEVERFQKTVDGVAESESWCMAFVQTVIKEVGEANGIKSTIKKSEGCTEVWENSPSLRRTKPKSGYVIIWQHGNSWKGHTGFVDQVLADGTITTVEGNVENVNTGEAGVWNRHRSVKAGVEGDMHIRGYLDVFGIDKV